jgi:NADH-quinone oxidoreductase subunit N
MSAAAATIPMLIVVLAAIAAMLAEAIRHPGERMYIAGFGLIGLTARSCASCFLWDTDALSFGVVRADNFALFVNIILCIIGIVTMVFSHEVVEREGLPAGEYYALTLFAISGMMLMAAAVDLLVIFLALEVLSLAVYVLTGRGARARSAPRRRSSASCSARSRRVLPVWDRVRVRAPGSTRLGAVATAMARGSTTEPLQPSCPVGLLAPWASASSVGRAVPHVDLDVRARRRHRLHVTG